MKAGLPVQEFGSGRSRRQLAVRKRAGGHGRRRTDGGRVDVQAGVLLLPLGPPVLEPDLHLHTISTEPAAVSNRRRR